MRNWALIALALGAAVCALVSTSFAAADESATSATDVGAAVGTVRTDESKIETTEKTPSRWGALSGNLSMTSDYISRGLSYSDHNPAAQGEVDWNHPMGFALSAWASNTKIPDTTNPDQTVHAEVDWSGGYTYSLTDAISAGVGVRYYSYYNGSDMNFLEYPLQLSWNEAKLGLAFAPHWGGGDAGHCWYLSAGWSHVVKWQTSLNLTVGYSMFAPELGLNDYADFHAGLSREMLGLTWDVSGYFVNAEQFNGQDDPRAVLTISKSL